MTYALSQIPNLPPAIAITGSELIEAVQNGTSVRVTLSQIAQAGTVTQASNVTVSPYINGWNNVQDALTGLYTTKVDRAGDTMTGGLTISTTNANITINKAANVQAATLIGQTGGSNRWIVNLGDTTAEGGSNAGSNFSIQRCADNGAVLGTPFSINRATGVANFNQSPTITTTNANLLVNKLASGQSAQLLGATNGSSRWGVVLGNVTAEGGSNTGSDFAIQSYTDGSVLLDTPLAIARSTSIATFSQLPVIPVTTPTSANQVASKGYVDAAVSGGGAAQPANVVFAGPATGSPATPTWRTLVAADTPQVLPLAGGSLSGTLNLVTGAADAKLVLNPTGAFRAALFLENNGVVKWEVGKATDDSFFIFDGTTSANVVTLATGGTLQLLRPVSVTGTLAVSGNTTLGGQLIENTGAATAVVNLNPTGAFQASLLFNNGGVSKWQLGKQTDDTFFFYDGAAASNVWTCATGAAFTIQRATQVNGTLNVSSTLTVSGSASLNGNTTTNYIQVTSAANTKIVSNPVGAFQGTIDFMNSGVMKWQFGKQGTDSFFFWDAVASINVWTMSTGANFTFNVPVMHNGGAGSSNIYTNAATGAFANFIYGQKGLSSRWSINLGNATAEGTPGTNIGSDFAVNRYNDSGVLIDTPLTITRSTGVVSFNQNPVIATASGVAPNLVLNKAASGVGCVVVGQLTGLNRWSVVVGNNAADANAGANTGSDFSINRFNDAGTIIDSPVIINRASGVMTLNQDPVVAPASGAAAITLTKPASGQACAITATTAGSTRWNLILGNATSESGSNVGSDFNISRYSDAGAFLDAPMSIDRAGGNVTHPNNLIVGGTITQGGQGVGLSFRNKLINGDFRINQYYGTTSPTPVAGNTYIVDRWFYAGSQASKFSFQTVSSNPTFGFGFYEVCVVNSAYTPAVGESFAFAQAIEAYNLADLKFGTAAAQPVTLSFWAYSSIAGTHSGAVKGRAGTRSYPFTYTLAAATWTKIAIVVPGDTGGTWYASDNNAGMYVVFNLGTGANLLGAAGSWSGGNYNGATGSVSIVSTAGATFNISNVQLEIGSAATPFEVRPLSTELQMCERYYQTSYDPGVTPGSVSNNGAQGHVIEAASSFPSIQLPFRTPMRAAPTITLYSPNTGAAGKIYDQNTPQDVAGTTGFLGTKGTTAIVNSVGIAVGHSIYVHYAVQAEL